MPVTNLKSVFSTLYLFRGVSLLSKYSKGGSVASRGQIEGHKRWLSTLFQTSHIHTFLVTTHAHISPFSRSCLHLIFLLEQTKLLLLADAPMHDIFSGESSEGQGMPEMSAGLRGGMLGYVPFLSLYIYIYIYITYLPFSSFF